MGLFSKKKEVKQAPPLGAMYVPGVSGATWMQRDYKAFSREGYIQNAVAFSCISRIAKAAASVPLYVAKMEGDALTDAPNHLANKLLKRPNIRSSCASFIEAMLSFKLIYGNVFVLATPEDKLTGEPSELWLLRPDRVRVHHDDNGQVEKYEYSTGAGKRFFPVDKVTGQSAVLHIASFNPIDDYMGLSPMEAAAYSVDIFNEAQEWNKKLLQNGAAPSGAFRMGTDSENGSLSDEQFNRMREMMDEQVAGSKNAGRPLLLEGGLDWKEMGLSPRDMDFESNLWAAARMIATVYGVPPQLVNVPGGDTYNNLMEAKLSLWQDTVLPHLNETLQGLNNWLMPRYGKDGAFITYDEDSIPALEEKRQSKFERLENVSFLTMNEKRRAAGFEDKPGSDDLLVDSNKIPVGLMTDEGA